MKYLIAAGIVLALAIINGMFADRDEQIRAEALQSAERKKAELFANIISQCLNGGTIRVGDTDAVSCEQRAEKRNRR